MKDKTRRKIDIQGESRYVKKVLAHIIPHKHHNKCAHSENCSVSLCKAFTSSSNTTISSCPSWPVTVDLVVEVEDADVKFCVVFSWASRFDSFMYSVKKTRCCSRVGHMSSWI